MNYFGARAASDQYIPKGGIPRPAWTYRGARRNVARDMHWPNRYRWRRLTAALREKLRLIAFKLVSTRSTVGA